MRRSLSFIVNFPSMHMSYMYKILSNDYYVNIITYDEMPKQRINEGWSELKSSNLNITSIDDLPDDFDFGIIICCGYESVLKFNSLNIIVSEILYLAEPPIYYNFFDYYLKKLKYIYMRFKYLRNINVHCFGIGSNSIFYKSIFVNFQSFIYFLDKPKPKPQSNKIRNGFVYIGSLSKRKNIIPYLKHFDEQNISIDVYSADNFSMNSDSVKFLGPVNNDHVLNKLIQYEFLILPSLFDGWGMVVSEAIASGCKVVISDRVGSYYLKKYFDNDFIVCNFPSAINFTTLINNTENISYDLLMEVQDLYIDNLKEKINALYC